MDWSRTKKGRVLSLLLNISTLAIMSWTAAARYTTEKFVPYLSSIRVEEVRQGLFLVDDLSSLILLIYVAPVIITAMMLFAILRHFQIHQDILFEQFLTWEMPFMTRFTHTAEMDKCDVIIGYKERSKKPIVIKEDQRYLHEGSFGATGSGKTSTSILLRITQDLIKIATGRRKMGLVFLEPKGDGIDDVLTLAKKLGIPDEKIMVIDPTKAFSAKYNPFAGPSDAAAAAFQGTLNALTGDQDEFFKGQQNEAAQTYTLLAKIRYGNLTNITHIQRMFTDPRYLADIVEEVSSGISNKLKDENTTPEDRKVLESWENIVRYFEDEVLDFKTFRTKDEVSIQTYPPGTRYEGRQVVENKKDKFVTGAKKYLNEIALNSMLSDLFVTEDGDMVFDADEFLANGGVLLVNTALAELEELSLMFGQFFIRQLQSAVFRRPKEGRIPIFLYVDEFPLYVNEAFERFLTLGRSYKVGTLIAMQSLGQLDNVVKGFKETVLSNASSKTVFGRGTVADNKYFSEEFGEELTVEESVNESASPMTTDAKSWGFRMNTQKKYMPRFSPTQIRELPFKQMVVQVVDENNSISISTKAIGKFVHEASFLKRYLRVKGTELKSTEEKDFIIETMVNQDSLMNIKESLSDSPSDDTQHVDETQHAAVSEASLTKGEQTELELGIEITEQVEELVPIPTKRAKKMPISKDVSFQTEIDYTINKEYEAVVPASNVSVPSDEINQQVDSLVSQIRDLPEAKDSQVPPPTVEEVFSTEEVASVDDFHEFQKEIDFNKLFPEPPEQEDEELIKQDSVRVAEVAKSVEKIRKDNSVKEVEMSAAPPQITNAPMAQNQTIIDDF